MGCVASFANSNRTSMYTLTQISSDSAGDVVCQATYTTAPTSSTGAKTFMLQFAPPVLEAFNTTVRAQTNSFVTLSCELYGYLFDGAEPHICWQKLPSMAITSNDPLYTISSTNGSKQIQNGGSTPSPSFISSLTIDLVDETVAGTYLCSSRTGTGITIPSITLTVTGAGHPANTEMPTDGHDSIIIILLAVIGGVVGGLALTVLVVIAVVIIAVVMCRRQTNSENIYDLPADYEKPIPPPVDSLPPRREVNLAYEQVKSFDMTDNSAYNV